MCNRLRNSVAPSGRATCVTGYVTLAMLSEGATGYATGHVTHGWVQSMTRSVSQVLALERDEAPPLSVGRGLVMVGGGGSVRSRGASRAPGRDAARERPARPALFQPTVQL
ncbi:hypothetical protein GCM10010269_66580 [Streptomyces humidus]|uniref:Uncharacterized protein n=1 Tax=Streptomyces humidus TaxID=52259 RepID=A0A918G472_9ACTN|nr:hypothetical protein GCM10010269_66580 [Streptomyces humidus]